MEKEQVPPATSEKFEPGGKEEGKTSGIDIFRSKEVLFGAFEKL
jgi:hypothetical protein